MLDSNNAERPSGSSYAQHRDMPYHDIQVVKALLNGNVNQEPVESLDQKSTGLTILAFLPLAKAFIQAIKDRDAEARVSREGAGEKRAFAHITIDTAEIGLSKLRKMFANFKSAGETLYVCIVPGREPLVIYMATKWLDFLIDTKTERWILEKNDQSQQANFVCFVLSSADTFMAMMARAGEQFEFHRAVKAKDLSGVSKEMMQDAMDFAEDALRDAKKWVKRGVACDVKPSFAPVMSKKAKGGATPARNQGAPPAAPARGGGQAAAPAAPPAGATNWASLRASQPPRNGESRSEEEIEASKRKGDLIARPRFQFALASGLQRIYCAPHAIKGKACRDRGCNLRHWGLHKWDEEHKKRQIEHVEANQGQVWFNKFSTRCLPANKAHLLGDDSGPSRGN